MLPPDQKAGLERLAQAVSRARIGHIPKEKPEGIARRLEWARTIEPGDDLESLQARQGLSRSQVASRISLMRRYVGLSKAPVLASYHEVAQRYLEIHAGRRFHE
ncbi:hypothetical protein [Nannocystis sp. SCPEA4]|uniref:hypothetical protein n=1 Tax=Nannocystis sp. SCPEA4 TaxID=2996787 RepID=UPI002271AB83|nr:hypothetical protein [Nannocystis sp. SCPEA4]MCY1055418.1 hypothetical protein [Nannocystis sp. SCPEA4]